MRTKSYRSGNPGALRLLVAAAALMAATPSGAQIAPPPGSFTQPGEQPAAAPPPLRPGTVQVGPAPAAPAPAPGTIQVGPAPQPGTVQVGPALQPGTVQIGPAPTGPGTVQGTPPGTVMVPGPQIGPPPGANVCQTEAEPLVKTRTARLAAFQAAAKRKAQAPELCGLIKAFVANESKFRAFLVKNKTNCNIPDEIIGNVQKNYGQAAAAQRKICAAAAGPRPGPGGPPSFGTPYRKGTGTFDTLGGSPIN